MPAEKWRGQSKHSLREHAGASTFIYGDNIATYYTSLADDSALGKKKSEAGMLASVAEGHLKEGSDFKEALKAANEAVTICYEIGDKDAMADMVRLVVKAYLLKASIARYQRGSEAASVEAESMKKAEQIAQSELKLFRQAGCLRGQAAMLLSTADILVERASVETTAAAIKAATEACALFERLGDKKMQAVAFLTQVSALGARREKTKALKAAETALELFRDVGDKVGEAQALHAVSVTHVTADLYSKYTDAVQFSKDALALFEELNLRRFQANELLHIAGLNLERDSPEQAIPPAKQALEILRQMGSDYGAQATAVGMLVQAYAARDQDDQSLQAAKEGLDWIQNAGDKKQEVMMLDMIAHVYLKTGNTQEALLKATEGCSVSKELGDKTWEARMQLTSCQVHVKQGEVEKALRSVQSAIKLLEGLSGVEHDLATAYHVQADVHCVMQNYADALESAHQAQEYFEEADEPYGEALVLLLRAGLSGDPEAAVVIATQAQDIFNSACEHRMESIALNALVDLHLAQKDYDRALEAALSRRVLMQEAGFRREEAKALHTIAGIYKDTGDADQALRTAREGMKMARAEGDKVTDLYMSIRVIQASVLIIEDAATTTPSDTKLIASTIEDATRVARDAVALARKLGRGDLTGPAAYWQSQLFLISFKPDAVSAASEALALFQEAGDPIGEAHTLVLMAQCSVANGNRPEAEEQARSALKIFTVNHDEEGKALALSVIGGQRPAGGEYFQPIQAVAAEPVASMVEAAKPKGPDPIAIQKKIKDLVAEALDAEEVPLDTPLMDSGLDSLASVSFRNEVSKEFNTTLPASLIFDYPTINGLTQFLSDRLASGDET